MKFADINKKFSKAVAEKLANGFQICCNTMSSRGSEIANVNFIDAEGDHYTLMLNKRFSGLNEDRILLDQIVITWAKSKELKGDFNGRTDVTFWTDENYVEVIEQKFYWKVGENYFVDSKEEAKRISDVRRKHWRRKFSNDYCFEFDMPMNGETRKLAANLYRKNKPRYQKAKISAADINSVRVSRQNGTRAIEIRTATEKVRFNVNISVKG